MVKSIEVKNFKSLADLKIELGRVNIFIGENGSGKSNILEAIAFGAAASANKLDKEFLASRGMRVPEPKLMRSAFSKEDLDKNIQINIQSDSFSEEEPSAVHYNLKNSNSEFSKWEDEVLPENLKRLILDYLFHTQTSDQEEHSVSEIQRIDPTFNPNDFEAVKGILKLTGASSFNSEFIEEMFMTGVNKAAQTDKSNSLVIKYFLNRYKIFAPENTFLRKFEDEEAGDPLGIRGEGLFRLLRYFQNHEDKKYVNAIKEALSALDWFEDFNIADNLSAGERKLSIIDRFLDPDVSISQSSANEGFLFILFYISLFVSPDTPSFFAVDNLDASFNPKLCKHITRVLIKTARDFNKQALFTTHNPFILDGLDLADDEQRLFVVYRSQEGHTIAKRILPNERKMPLSEQWMNGYLGGLPQNF
jgi:AAA15 family ATPase/GTPase